MEQGEASCGDPAQRKADPSRLFFCRGDILALPLAPCAPSRTITICCGHGLLHLRRSEERLHTAVRETWREGTLRCTSSPRGISCAGSLVDGSVARGERRGLFGTDPVLLSCDL